jgi:hypothetical protein
VVRLESSGEPRSIQTPALSGRTTMDESDPIVHPHGDLKEKIGRSNMTDAPESLLASK